MEQHACRRLKISVSNFETSGVLSLSARRTIFEFGDTNNERSDLAHLST